MLIVVENNLLGGSEWLQTEKAREHGADVLSCSFDPTLLKYTEVKGQLGLSKEMVPSKIPSAVGNAGGSLSSEFGSSIIQRKKDAMEAGK